MASGLPRYALDETMPDSKCMIVIYVHIRGMCYGVISNSCDRNGPAFVWDSMNGESKRTRRIGFGIE